MGLFGGIKYVSNHGSSQGIIPRFFYNFEKMAKMALMGSRWPDAKAKYLNYETRNQEDFTNFYDTFHEILNLRHDYIEGINNGKYFSRTSEGGASSDVTPEITIRKRIKEFFISGKQLLNNFVKSELLDDGSFQLGEFVFAKDTHAEAYLEKNRETFRFKNGYTKVYNIARAAQTEFQKDFLELRNLLEHDYNISIEPFEISYLNGQINIIEPQHEGINIFDLIDKYYYSTLDLIDDMAAYFYGVNACAFTKGKITLFKRITGINPAKFKFKYEITLDVGDPILERLINVSKK